jgi:hypothetical protein
MTIREIATNDPHHASCTLAALLAGEFVDRCGERALQELVVLRDVALGQGDAFSAEGWRHVLRAAENILEDMSRSI